MDHRFPHRIDKFVGVEKPPTLVVSAFETAEFTATRVQWQRTEAGHPVQFDCADGYMVCLQRRDVPAQPYWVDQVQKSLGPMQAGQFLLLDLHAQHSSLVPSGVDCVSIFTSRGVLLRFEAEHELPAGGELRTPVGAIHDDPVLRHLGETLMPAIELPHLASQLYVEHVALAILSRLIAQFGCSEAAIAPVRGGLAPWQLRRAMEMLMAHIDGSIGLEALAHECRLSRSHFARAFRISTGMSPLRWLALQRVERAKMLLLNTRLALEQIAASSGFVDASHLSRAFVRATGRPPATWRRLSRP